MLYDFYYKLQKEWPKSRDPKLLEELTDIEIEVLKHVYFNKTMPKKELVKQKILKGIDYEDVSVSFVAVIRYANTRGRDTEQLIKYVLSCLNEICEGYGTKEARRASKVIFCEAKVNHLTAEEVLEELKRREDARRKLMKVYSVDSLFGEHYRYVLASSPEEAFGNACENIVVTELTEEEIKELSKNDPDLKELLD